MSIPCPYCKSPLNPKGLKPGQFKPKCPKCAKQFVLVVPADPDGTIMANVLPENAPRPPEATGDFTEPNPDPGATGEYTELANTRREDDNPDATGEFTEPATRPSAGPGIAAPDTDVQARPVEKPPPAKGKKKEEPAIPDRLGGYEVLKVLGKGGMGAVLLGRQVSLDRKVALKIMHAWLATNPGFVARFVREAYAAAQLNHHNVVQVYDIGEDGGTHFFSMEYVPGRSLMDEVKAAGKLDAEVAVGYVLQAARGLRYGHNQGMVHRDVKPDNLLLNTDGVVKVADLGLVKLPTGDLAPATDPGGADAPDAAEGDTERLTRAGAVMGTPAYMPPEQAKDSANVDQRADIYSLGCSLYVLVTGKPPFEGKTAMEVISKHQTEPIVPPEAIVKRVPKALSGILQKMLAKRPEDRYQTMDDVIAALEEFLGVSRAGPFTPKEEQADALEKAANAFTTASKGGLRKLLGLGFFGACVLAILALGVIGKTWSLGVAGGVLGLLVLTPVAYFVISGVMGKTYLFAKVREVVFGARIVDWLMWAGGLLLFLAALYIFGLLWYWLGFCVLAVGLAFALWFLTDRAEQTAQEEPLTEARHLFKQMRLQGLEEEALRQFVCKYAGANWEAFYEALFGYEAKLAARAYRKGAVTEPAKAYGAWREPVVAWIDARTQARKEAAERRHLLKVQAKALEAEGVNAKEAKEQAEELADVMVGAAAGAREAAKAGKTIDLKGMVAVARARKRPPAGYNIAGVPLRKGRAMKDVLNAWVGRRLRFLVGAAVFAVGLLWLNQNKAELRGLQEKAHQAASSLQEGDLSAAGSAATKAAGESQKADAKGLKPLAFLPEGASHFGTPLAGLLLMLTGVFYYGWRPTLVAVPGCLLAVFGPAAGVPDAGPVKAWMLSTLVGAVLMLGVGRVLRD